MVLLVRNRVKDIDHWKKVFDEQEAAGLAAGLSVERVWRSADKSDEVFFILGVEDRAKAETYMATPEAAAVGEEAGALEGEFWFLEDRPATGNDGDPGTRHQRAATESTVGPTLFSSGSTEWLTPDHNSVTPAMHDGDGPCRRKRGAAGVAAAEAD